MPISLPMKLLYSYLRKYRGSIALALVLATINQVFSLLDPLIFRYVIDDTPRDSPNTPPASSSRASACCWPRPSAWHSSRASPRTSRTTTST